MKKEIIGILILLISFIFIFGLFGPLFEQLEFIVYPIASIISLLVADFFYKAVLGDEENYDKNQEEIDREKYEREQDELNRRYFNENQPDIYESDESDENSENCCNDLKYFSKDYFITDIEFEFKLDDELNNNLANNFKNMSCRLDENHIMVKPFGFDKYEASSFEVVVDDTGNTLLFYCIYDKNGNKRPIANLLLSAEILISQIFRDVSEEGITFYFLRIKNGISGKSTRCLIPKESIKENLFIQKGKIIGTRQFFVQNRNGEIKPIIQFDRIYS